jgi:hypothetical protein
MLAVTRWLARRWEEIMMLYVPNCNQVRTGVDGSSGVNYPGLGGTEYQEEGV